MLLAAFASKKSTPSDRQGDGQSGKESTNSISNVASAIATHRLGAKIVRGVASGIGLASESIHHHKSKAPKEVEGEAYDNYTWTEAEQEASAEYQANISQQMHEAAWQLDEAQDQFRQEEPPAYNEDEGQAESFLASHPTHQTESKKLAMPVQLTQRRPGKRSRGFVRAYAPCLNDVGIDLVTFLDLIDKLNEAIIPSGLIQALNLASLAGLAIPGPLAVLISVGVQIATNIGDEIHSRTKTNKFLDQINESFFAPRGLVALVMTWKPNQANDMITMVDMNQSVEQAATKNEGSSFKKFQSSSGSLPFEWPETAPLVFPVLDDLTAEEAKKPAIKRAGNFVGEYMDKRARAKWAGQNPDSKMANAGPKDEFHSRYADPSHPASSGDILALVTGGHVQTGKLVSSGIDAVMNGGSRSKKANARDEQEQTYDPYYGQAPYNGSYNQPPHNQQYSQPPHDQSYNQPPYNQPTNQAPYPNQYNNPQEPYNQASYHNSYNQTPHNEPYNQVPYDGSYNQHPQNQRPAQNGSLPAGGGIAMPLLSGVKKIFQSDVLYLMIVNRPTQEEIEASMAYLNQSY